MTSSPDPQLVRGWTVQNQTATPIDDSQAFTSVEHSVVDEAEKPTGTRSKTDQKPA